jgi:hypothetical protein
MRPLILLSLSLVASECKGKQKLSSDELERLRESERIEMLNQDFYMGNTKSERRLSPEELERLRTEAQEERSNEALYAGNGDRKKDQKVAGEDAMREQDEDGSGDLIITENNPEDQMQSTGAKQTDMNKGKEQDLKQVSNDADPIGEKNEQQDQGKLRKYGEIARELGGKYGGLFMVNAKYYGGILWQLTKHYGKIGWTNSKHYGRLTGQHLKTNGKRGFETGKQFAKYGYKKAGEAKRYALDGFHAYMERRSKKSKTSDK